MPEKIGAVLVVGAGISGIQSALDLADSGYKVYLLDKKPSIGGTMVQLDKTFPTNDCSMCILAPKLVGAGRHHNIELITNSEIKSIEGDVGNFKVNFIRHARSVDSEKCTGCGLCTTVCPVRFKIQPKEKPDEPPQVRDREKIDEMVKNNSRFPQPLIQILLDVNEEYRYLPKDVLEYLAYTMDIPLSQIYRVATFYKAFSLVPIGKYHVKVCLGTSCHVRGARPILKAVQENIADTPEGLFSIQTVNCLGACAMGPVVMVNDDYHSNMDTKKVETLVSGIKEEEKDFVGENAEEIPGEEGEAAAAGGEA